jgi:hypothetical protein
MRSFLDNPFSRTLSSSTQIVSPWEYVVLVKDVPLLILAAPKAKIFGTQRARHGKAFRPSK